MILRSDLEMELLRMKMQGNTTTAADICPVLENLLIHDLLLDQADLDSVTTDLGRVNQEVDQRISYFIMQTGSEAELERQYGRSIRDIKREMRELIGEQQRAEHVRSQLVKGVKITPSAVEGFYRKQVPDSLPTVPERYVLRQIVLNPISSADAEYAVKERLIGLRERILKGERFSTLAMAYSEDRSSAAKGGEMDYLPRESFVKAFADVAFSLQDGQVSQIVKTEYGYHIIQMVGRKGNMAKVRHILLKPNYTSDVIATTVARLDSVRTEILNDSITFEDAAAVYSDDKDTRLNGGLMTDQQSGAAKLQKETMVPVDYYEVRKLKDGQITQAFESRDRLGNVVVKIIKLERTIPSHRVNLTEDYADVQQLAKRQEEQKLMARWIQRKQQSIYMRIDKKFADCKFQYPYWKEKMAE
jgi:peptidyl-prolyl cis-trans isomerase, PPIC-type